MAKLTTTDIYGNLNVHGLVTTDSNFISIRDTDSTYFLRVVSDSTPTLTANRNLSIDIGNEDRILGLFSDLYIGTDTTKGAITITSNDTNARSLTLEASTTIQALTNNYPIYAKGANTIGTEQYLNTVRGGTGIGSYAVGDILYANSATSGAALTKLTIGTTGKMMRTTGTAPSWTTFTMPDTIAVGSIFVANTANVVTALTSASGLKSLQISETTISWNATTGTGNTVYSTSPSITTPVIVTSITPNTNDASSLGTSSIRWSDLYLAAGAVLDFGGDITLTHSTDVLTFAGGTLALGSNSLTMTGAIAASGARVSTGYFTTVDGNTIIANTIARPDANDGAGLGNASYQWSDLFLASGAVINFGASNVTLTHSTGVLTLAGTLALGSNNLTMTGTLASSGARVSAGYFTALDTSTLLASTSVTSPTMQGSTSASGTLLLQSTSNATKGVVTITGSGVTLSHLTTAGAVYTSSTGAISSETYLSTSRGGTGANTFTQGSIVFAGASGVYTQDNTNFFWDNTNKLIRLNSGIIKNSTITLPTAATRYLYIDIPGATGSYGSYEVLVSGHGPSNSGAFAVSFIVSGDNTNAASHIVFEKVRNTTGNPVIGDLIRTATGAAISLQNTGVYDLTVYISITSMNNAVVEPVITLNSTVPTGNTVYANYLGNFGVGTFTPTYKLEAVTSGADVLKLTNSSGSYRLSGTTFTAPTTFNLLTTGASTLTLDSGTTGAVNLGTNSNAKTITIGNTTGATAVDIKTGTGNLDITTPLTTISGDLTVIGTSTFNEDLYTSSIYLEEDASSTYYLRLYNNSALSANRTLTIDVNNADRTIDISGNVTTAGAFTTAGAYNITLTATNTTSITLPTSGTLAIVGNPLSQFASTTSAQLAGVISDETGTGVLVYNTSPTFSTSIKLYDSDSTTYSYTISPGNIGANTSITLPTTSGAYFAVTDQSNGKVNLGSTTYVTGTLAAGNGGTGVANSFTLTVSGANKTLAGAGSTITIGASPTINGSGTLTLTSNATFTTALTVKTGALTLSAHTSGTTATFPASGSITLVDTATSQSLTNKTIDNILATGAATTADLWSEVTTGSIAIGAGLTSGTLNLDAVSTATHTSNLSTGATISGATKTVNIGTSGAAGSTTNVVIGSTSGGTTTIYSPSTVVSGNLTVQGTLVYIDVEDLRVEDKNIELGYVTTPTDVTANGGGITLKGSTDKTIVWDSINANWTSSEHWNLASGKEYKINNASVLSATTLGSSVVSSSLTSVGTIATGTWNATTIAVNKGGTGLTSYAVGDILYASGTTTIAKLADVATGNVVISGGVGVAPSYGKVGLTTHITGTLAVGNGGTGATTLTSTGILVGNGTSAISAPGPTLTSTTMTFGGAGTINSTSTNALTLDSGTTGAVNLGTNANAKTVTIGNATGATGVVVNSGTAGVTFNQVAAGIFKIQASAAPTTDMVQITNAGKPTVTAGVNGLNVTYVGGAAAVESSAIRADITPGTTSGGIWNTFKVVSTAAAASGVTMNVFKIDNKTTGAGTSNILYAGTGYDNIINYNGTTVINGTGNVIAGQLSGTIPSAVLGNSTVYIGTTGVALNRASATLSLANIKLGSLTTNGPIYTSGSDGTLNSETYLDVTRGGTGVGSFNAGQILYGAGTADIATSANLFWDSTNNRLGIYEGAPAERLHINGDFRIDDSSGNAGFKMSYNNISKTLDFAWVGA